jgi:hypothetical protein
MPLKRPSRSDAIDPRCRPALRLLLSGWTVDEPTVRPDDVLDVSEGIGDRVDDRQAVVGHHLRDPTQRRAVDNAAVDPGLPMLAVENQQRVQARAAQKVQGAEVNDHRSLQPRKVPNGFCYQGGVGRVDLTAYPQDGSQVTGMNMQLCTAAVDLVAAARLPGCMSFKTMSFKTMSTRTMSTKTMSVG